MARHPGSDFEPAAASLPRHFSSGRLCLLAVKCGLSRLGQACRGRKVQNVVSATRGDHSSMLGTHCSHRREAKPSHFQVRHRAATARTSIRTTRRQPGEAFSAGAMQSLLLESPPIAVNPAKLLTTPLPHCCSDPFKMTPRPLLPCG